jgi:penicillin-binding protein A
MEVTIHSGTCRQAFSNHAGKNYLGNIMVAGKTGTLRPDTDGTTLTSWFVGFAPSRAPEVVVAVMLQNGIVWRRKANEVARDLLRCYFAGRPLVTDPFAKPAPPSELEKTALRPG